MPIYEYTCSSCERGFELLVRGSQAPECPTCGSRQLERQLSVPAAHTASSRGGGLPVSQSDAAPPCGAGFCRTGKCDLG